MNQPRNISDILERLANVKSSGINSIEDLRFLFSHLLLNLPQVLTPSLPDINGGRK